MKDSQRGLQSMLVRVKYIKANNERFSTVPNGTRSPWISISRRIMKDSQPCQCVMHLGAKYIKANNEDSQPQSLTGLNVVKYIKANNERFSTAQLLSHVRVISISRRIMKDSQQVIGRRGRGCKYIKANNERFSTRGNPAGYSC